MKLFSPDFNLFLLCSPIPHQKQYVFSSNQINGIIGRRVVMSTNNLPTTQPIICFRRRYILPIPIPFHLLIRLYQTSWRTMFSSFVFFSVDQSAMRLVSRQWGINKVPKTWPIMDFLDWWCITYIDDLGELLPRQWPKNRPMTSNIRFDVEGLLQPFLWHFHFCD
jgi:hypothetical protein